MQPKCSATVVHHAHAGHPRRHLQQAACTGSVVSVTDAPLSVRQAADRFGTIPRVLLAANPQLTADTTIAPGSTLCIPPQGNRPHLGLAGVPCVSC